MGNILASHFSLLCPGKKKVDILMVGLENAGKKTILHKLKHGAKEASTTGSIKENKMVTVTQNNISFNLWNVKWTAELSSEMIAQYFRPKTIKGMIIVIDCSDRESFALVKHQFSELMLQDNLCKAAVLIFANKQDQPGAMQGTELIDKLDLDYQRGKNWHIQTSCAITGVGLHDGLQWLGNQMNER